MKRFAFALFAMIIILGFFFRVQIKEFARSALAPKLPEEKSMHELAASSLRIERAPKASKNAQDKMPVHAELKGAQEIPAETNLTIPFVSQAPFQDWSLPYKEACEEASVIMAHYFMAGKILTSQTMKDEILKLVEWQEKTFGRYQDTTAEETARILREYFGHGDVQVRYKFTMDDIRREVAEGHPVLLPAAGRLLPNPYFRQPGPVYHMLVVKGYTSTKIITNDPGTRRGKDFLYDPEVLMNAIHDWKISDITEGRRAAIVIRE